jgi:hypothetical protein
VITAKYLPAIALTMCTVFVSIALTAGGAWLAGTISGVGTDISGFGTTALGPVTNGPLTTIAAASIPGHRADRHLLRAARGVLVPGSLAPQGRRDWFDVCTAFERLVGPDPGPTWPRRSRRSACGWYCPAVIGVTRAPRREVKRPDFLAQPVAGGGNVGRNVLLVCVCAKSERALALR